MKTIRWSGPPNRAPRRLCTSITIHEDPPRSTKATTTICPGFYSTVCLRRDTHRFGSARSTRLFCRTEKVSRRFNDIYSALTYPFPCNLIRAQTATVYLVAQGSMGSLGRRSLNYCSKTRVDADL